MTSNPSDFETKLARYADLIVAHGLNVQPEQFVQISSEPIHREFALMLTKAAYDRGAKFVHVGFADPAVDRIRLQESDEASLDFVPPYVAQRYDFTLDERGASVRILGERDPDVLADLPPERVNRMRLAQRRSLKRFYEEALGKSLVHWSVVAAATPAWGKKIFPDLTANEACERLWEQIFQICRVDDENYLQRWKTHNDKLQSRAKRLTERKVETLRFTGPGTDLTVKLSQRARFAGGTEMGPHGVEFEPNIPTEEIFTTPDWRGTEGFARATRPFFINGKLIKGLTLVFKNGEISEFEAEEGKETFAAYIGSDPGAKRLGEVALVGIDSPIYQSGLVFEEILFDENAACHIAVGLAYKFCIDGSADLSPDELDHVGCNESSVHTDMMISSEEVDVSATTYAGESFKLIERGRWCEGW